MTDLLSRLAARAKGQTPASRPVLAPRILLAEPHDPAAPRPSHPRRVPDAGPEAPQLPTTGADAQVRVAAEQAQPPEQATARRDRHVQRGESEQSGDAPDRPTGAPRSEGGTSRPDVRRPPATAHQRDATEATPSRRRHVAAPGPAAVTELASTPVAAAVAPPLRRRDPPRPAPSADHETFEPERPARQEHGSPTPVDAVELVPARPVPAPPALAVQIVAAEIGGEPDRAPTPTVHISIGRVDIRSAPPTGGGPPAEPRHGQSGAAPADGILSLSAYLHGSDGSR